MRTTHAVRLGLRQIIGVKEKDMRRLVEQRGEAYDSVRDKYRDAIDQALKRCTPLHFTDAMGGAVAGRPIAIRFVDERTIEPEK